jgi:hypothetical protein
VLPLLLLQQNPLVVEVIKQPEAAPDISVTYILNMFLLAGVALAVAAVGGLIVGALFVLYRKYHDRTAPGQANDLRLRI